MFLSVPNESPSFIMAIFPIIHPYSNNAIISESLKYLFFYSRDTPIKLSLIW